MGKAFISRKKMGFVFNLESWVYSNIDEIFEIIQKSNLNIRTSQLNLLSRVKSRINAQRIWRIYFLVNYLDWFNKRYNLQILFLIQFLIQIFSRFFICI